VKVVALERRKTNPWIYTTAMNGFSNFLYFFDVHRSGTKPASILPMLATIYLCELTYIKLEVGHMGTCTNSSAV
jgi:hypothetical protein